MKHSRKILVMLIALGLCAILAACGAAAGNTGGDLAQAESVTEESRDEVISEAEEPDTESSEAESTEAESTEEESSEEESTEEESTEAESSEAESETDVKTADIGVITWSMDLGDEYIFAATIQTILSEEYSEQIGEVFVQDAREKVETVRYIMENLILRWEGDKIVIVIVNDEDGFTDEELLSILKEAEEAGIIAGVDHVIDGAPESTFVYDASDVEGCAALAVENAFK